ncbi:hypothetical protein V8E51_000051 [Hyaloscypha variabilis]
MVDILNIIFGIIGTLLAIGGIWATIWAARRYRNTTPGAYFSVSYCSKCVVKPRTTTATIVCMEWSAGIGVQPGKGTSADGSVNMQEHYALRQCNHCRCAEAQDEAWQSNVELGLIANASPPPTTHEDQPNNREPLGIAPDATNHRHNVLAVLREALVVLQRLA